MIELIEDRGYLWPKGTEHKAHRCLQAARDAYATRPWWPRSKRGVVVQAGGHCGIWAMHLQDHFDLVLTVEPEASNLAAMVRNCSPAGQKIRIIEGLLGPEVGSGELLFNAKNSGGHKCRFGSGDLAVWTIDALTEQHAPTKRVDVMILDIEGAELPALQGATTVIDRDHPVIQLEEREHCALHGYSLDDLHSWLSARDYHPVARPSRDVVYLYRP